MAITSNCAEIIITNPQGSVSFNKLITTTELSPAKTIYSEDRVYLIQNSENVPQTFWWNLEKAIADGYADLEELYDYFVAEIANQCGGGGGIESIVAGTNITVDDTDPLNPIISVQDITLSGEVTGSTSLSAIDKTAITNKTTETIVGTDYVLFGDTSDGDNLKKGLVSDIVALSGGGGGGTPAGSDTQIQINQSGAFFADSTFQKSDTDFNVGLDHTTQSPVTFTGSGVDDLIFLVNYFLGTYPTTYTVTIDGINKDILTVNTLSITGGSFGVGDTITNGLGASATIDAITEFPSDDKTIFVISSYTGTFSDGDTIDNGSGVTATLLDSVTIGDTFTWTDGTTTVTQAVVIDSNGIVAVLDTPTGHTLSDSWTWTYSTVNQNVLDFSNNDYKFQSTFGTDTFGYQIADNFLGYGIKGSLNTFTNVAGDSGISGFTNDFDKGLQFNNFVKLATGETSSYYLDTAGYKLSTRDALGIETYLAVGANNFSIKNDNSSNQNGIEFNYAGTGLLRLGNLSGGNGTSITIDDVNENITISNLSAYDDDTAAGVGGLTAGMVYMTTGSGSAPLNAAGILMIKQ